jgi:hypothetical protein
MTSPREFCEAMRELVSRSQRNPATAVSDQAYQMKIRILDHFIERNPGVEVFEEALRARIADPDPQKELSRGVCCQILNSWRSGSCHYTPERRLVLSALFPADAPSPIDGDERD